MVAKLVIALSCLSIFLVGCGSGQDSAGAPPESKVAGPGEGAMKEWAQTNPDNGKPGNDEKGDANTLSEAPK